MKGLNLLQGDGQGITSTYDNGAFHRVEDRGAHDICHAPRFVELLCIGVGGVVGVQITGMVNTCIYIVSMFFTSGGKFSMLLMSVSNNQLITFNFPFFDNLIFFHMLNI